MIIKNAVYTIVVGFVVGLFVQTSKAEGLTSTQREGIETINTTADIYVAGAQKLTFGGREKTVVYLAEKHHFPENDIPESVKTFIDSFSVRMVESIAGRSEISATILNFDKIAETQLTALQKVRGNFSPQAGKTRTSVGAELTYRSIVYYAANRGLFLSSQNELLFNSRMIGFLNSDGVIWDGAGLDEVTECVSPGQFHRFVNKEISGLIEARLPINSVFMSEIDSEFSFGSGQFMNPELIQTVTVGMEYGDGLDWSFLPHGTHEFSNDLPFDAPTFREYLMAENIISMLNAIDTDTILVIGATVHLVKVSALLENAAFVKMVKEKHIENQQQVSGH